jgi:Predicted membrane protein (DUF2085)
MIRWRPAASSLRAAFIAASAAWALLLIAAPFAASRPHASPLATLLIVGVYSIGSLVCHQLPERSYHLWSAQMPVCARCAGIYLGAAVSALIAAPFRNGARHPRAFGAPASLAQARLRSARAEARGFQPNGELGFQPSEGVPADGWRLSKKLALQRTSARAALALAVAPTLLTLVYEWTTGDMPAHAIRAAAGVPIGVAVVWLVVAAADNRVD